MFIVVCHLSARYDYQSLGRQMVLYVETAWSYMWPFWTASVLQSLQVNIIQLLIGSISCTTKQNQWIFMYMHTEAAKVAPVKVYISSIEE